MPQARIDISRLSKLRTQLGEPSFSQAVGEVLDDESRHNLIALLDEWDYNTTED